MYPTLTTKDRRSRRRTKKNGFSKNCFFKNVVVFVRLRILRVFVVNAASPL